jgi:hypothetical protein
MKSTTIFLWERIYTLLDIHLLDIKQAIKNYIKVDEVSMVRQEHSRFNSNKKSLSYTINLPPKHPKKAQIDKFVIA